MASDHGLDYIAAQTRMVELIDEFNCAGHEGHTPWDLERAYRSTPWPVPQLDPRDGAALALLTMSRVLLNPGVVSELMVARMRRALAKLPGRHDMSAAVLTHKVRARHPELSDELWEMAQAQALANMQQWVGWAMRFLPNEETQ